MNILVIGGTRFFGIHTVNRLLEDGHTVTLAIRGNTKNVFGDRVSYIPLERTDPDSMRSALSNKHFDAVMDKIAYCSYDLKYALDVLDCDKYILMSTTAVYNPKHLNTLESEYDPSKEELLWCKRLEYPYDVIKRSAECALWQIFPGQKAIAVRYPFVIGKDDYTKRLYFYVEHTIKQIPMYIDNLNAQMGFIHSREAGEFMAYLIKTDFEGAINGSSIGTISVREVIEYVEQKTATKAVLDTNGDPAPYNGEPEYSINIDKATQLGFTFSHLKDWIYDLIDCYIEDGVNTQ